MTKPLTVLATDNAGDPAVVWYNQLPRPVQARIEAGVRALVGHRRFKGKSFGPQSALELIYKVYVFWDAHTPQKVGSE